MASDNVPMSNARKKLLSEMVKITGQVYNGFICNWGPTAWRTQMAGISIIPDILWEVKSKSTVPARYPKRQKMQYS